LSRAMGNLSFEQGRRRVEGLFGRVVIPLVQTVQVAACLIGSAALI
jgi:hypothetical protein